VGLGVLSLSTGFLGWKYYRQSQQMNVLKQQVVGVTAERDSARSQLDVLRAKVKFWKPVLEFGRQPEDAWWNDADAKTKMDIIESIVILMQGENPNASEVPLVRLWERTPVSKRGDMLVGLKASVMAMPVEERKKYAEMLFGVGHPAVIALTNGAYVGHRTVAKVPKMVTRVVKTNSEVDENAYEIVQHKIIPASGIITIGSSVLRLVFVGDRWAIFASHILSTPDDESKNFYPEGSEMRVYIDGAYFLDRLDYSRLRLIGKDVVAYQFGKNFRTFKDIRHLFICDHDLNGREECDGFNVMLNMMGVPVVTKLRIRRSEEQITVKHSDSQSYDCAVAELWAHEPLPRGACGSVIIASDRTFARKVMGVHVANLGDRRGYSIVVTQEMLQDLDMIGVNSSVIPPTTLADTNSCKLVPQGNFTILGALKTPIYQPEKTKIRPSILHGRVAEVKKAPAVLSSFDTRMNVAVSPLRQGIEKYGNVAHNLDHELAKEALQHIFCTFKQFKTSLRRVLSLDEAINGLPIEFAEPLVMDTSPGYPYTTTMIREPGVKGKRNLFEGEPGKYVIKDQELEVRTELRWRMALKGQRIASAWLDTLKDECRTLDRVKAGKTRVFTIAPVDFTIVFRRLFLGFNVFVMENCLNFFSAVGVNTQSLSWTDLMRELLKVSDVGLAGDYSGWDGNLSPILMNELCECINDWYDDEEEFKNARRIIFDEIIHTVQISVNTVYMKHIGNPSGNPMTTILNTILNAAYLRMVWLKNAPAEYRSLVFFDENVRDFEYGDDNILAIKKEVHDFFNPTTISETMKDFGLTYTAADKKGEATFEKVEQLTFLKCGFRREGHYFLPLLDWDTIENMVMWYRKSDFETPMELTISNINESLRAAFFYGKEKFEEWRNIIMNEMPEKYHCRILDYTYFYVFFYDSEFEHRGSENKIIPERIKAEIERDKNGHHVSVVDKLRDMWIPLDNYFKTVETNGNTISNVTTVENYGKIDDMTIPSNMTGDSIGNGNSASIPLPMDKPARTANALPVFRAAFQNFSQTTGSELVNRLDLNPSNINENIPEHYGIDYDEMAMPFLLSRPTCQTFVPWLASNPPGTSLYSCYIGPQTDLFMTGTTLSANSPPGLPLNLTTPTLVRRTLFDYVTAPFRFWTGSIRVRLDIVSSQMHVGRLFFAVNYGVQPEEAVNFQEITSQYGVIIDLNNEQRTFTFDIPYKSQTQWMEVYHGGKLNGEVYAGNNNRPLDWRRYFLGTMRLTVLNSLVTTDAAPPDAEIIVSISGGEDFQVYYPAAQNFTMIPITYIGNDDQHPPKRQVAITNGDTTAGTDAVSVPPVQEKSEQATVDAIIAPEPVKTRPDFYHFGRNAPVKHLGSLIKRYVAGSYWTGRKRFPYRIPNLASGSAGDEPYGFIRLNGGDGSAPPVPNNLYMAYVIQSVQPVTFGQYSFENGFTGVDSPSSPLAYFGSMYRFWRGSMRYKMIYGRMAMPGGEEIDIRRYGSVFIPETTFTGATSGIKRNNLASIAALAASTLEGTQLDGNSSGLFKQNMDQTMAPLAGAMAHTNAPYVEIEVPFTSRFNVLRTIAETDMLNEAPDHFSVGMVVFYAIFGTSGDTNTVAAVQGQGLTVDWNLLIAAGDDFRFGGFIGPQPMLVNNFGSDEATVSSIAYSFWPDMWDINVVPMDKRQYSDEEYDKVELPQLRTKKVVARTNGDSKTTISSQGIISIGQRAVEEAEPGQGNAVVSNRLALGAVRESEWSLSDMTKRRTYITSHTWAVSNSRGTILYEAVVPQDLLTAGLQTAPFERFLYWNGSLRVYIQLNGTRFHTGRLQAFYVPMTSKLPIEQTQGSSFASAQCCQCVFLDAATSNEACLIIPYAHIYSFLNVTKTEPLSFVNFLGRMIVQVYSPLKATTSSPQTINFSIFVEFDLDQKFQIPRNTIQYSTFNQVHKKIVEKAVANTNGSVRMTMEEQIKHEQYLIKSAAFDYAHIDVDKFEEERDKGFGLVEDWQNVFMRYLHEIIYVDRALSTAVAINDLQKSIIIVDSVFKQKKEITVTTWFDDSDNSLCYEAQFAVDAVDVDVQIPLITYHSMMCLIATRLFELTGKAKWDARTFNFHALGIRGILIKEDYRNWSRNNYEQRTVAIATTNGDDLRVAATIPHYKYFVELLDKKEQRNPDFKSVSYLNELSMHLIGTSVEYVDCGGEGSDHEPTFTIEAKHISPLKELSIGMMGQGPSKKMAKESAATRLVDRIRHVLGKYKEKAILDFVQQGIATKQQNWNQLFGEKEIEKEEEENAEFTRELAVDLMETLKHLPKYYRKKNFKKEIDCTLRKHGKKLAIDTAQNQFNGVRRLQVELQNIDTMKIVVSNIRFLSGEMGDDDVYVAILSSLYEFINAYHASVAWPEAGERRVTGTDDEDSEEEDASALLEKFSTT
jgi:hypothetical protein